MARYVTPLRRKKLPLPKAKPLPRKTRADDERDLEMLELRCSGMTSHELGKKYGIAHTLVRTITNRIRDAHRAHSLEDTSWWW